jgi:endoglucanase
VSRDDVLRGGADRRRVLAGLGAVGLGAAARPAVSAPQAASWTKLPRWRGFNLLEKFTLAHDRPYREQDFDLISELGFDLVRLPLDYRIWTDDRGGVREAPLKEIDQAVEWGRAKGVHVVVCLHRAPGYCINPPFEPLDLWGEGEGSELARRKFADQWRMFAARYKGVPSSQLSFNLVNEPPNVTGAQYVKVATAAVEAIHGVDPDRLVIADGRGGGRLATPELVPLKIAQAGRGYEPFHLTHYKASWVKGSDAWPEPAWPLVEANGRVIDKAVLWREQIEPWKLLEAMGVGVIVGEWGAYRYTPHPVVLSWMEACLQNWREAGWGWCLWNFRGDFGPLDSGRSDVAYEDFHGAKLDRRMLDLLKRY